MGIADFFKGELIDVIEWTDDSRDTLSYRFPDDDKAIKNGAQLIVRESQVAQFVYLGEFGDTFLPGKHTLTTDNIPILTKLASWKYGFNSPFKADVYYVITRLFTGNKWGTSNPVMLRDNDFGVVRVRAFGTYDFRIVEPATFLREVAGSDHNFRLDEFTDTMRSRIVSLFTDAIASAKVPVLDVASRYSELGDALLPMINPAVTAKYGLEITSFIVENVSVPPEVESAIDKRASMTAIGNLNDYVKYQMAQGMEKGGGGAGPAGTAAELAVGFGLAQQMMQQGFTGGAAAPRGRRPELLGPAEAAQRARRHRGRRDGGARIGRAQGQEDRLVVAHHARRAQRLPRGVARWPTKFRRSRSTPARRVARRRNGTVEAETGVPVLRHRVAVLNRSRHRARSPRSDLDGGAARRRRGRARVAGDQRRSVQCQSCRAVMVYEAARVGQNCEFCGSPALVAYEEIKSPIRPEGVLPFRIDRNRVRDDIRRWWRSKWLAPGRLAKAALVDTVKQPLHSVLDLRCARALPVGCRGRTLLLRQRRRPRQQGQPRRAAGAARALGARVRRRRSHVRR